MTPSEVRCNRFNCDFEAVIDGLVQILDRLIMTPSDGCPAGEVIPGLGEYAWLVCFRRPLDCFAEQLFCFGIPLPIMADADPQALESLQRALMIGPERKNVVLGTRIA